MTDRRVLFFGDSLVAGVGDPSGRGWVGRVVAASFTAGVPVTAYNLGVRGETSIEVVSRWRREVVPRLSPGADTRVVVSFGANDTAIEAGQQRVDTEHSRRALETMLDRAAAIDLPVFVVGTAPVDDGGQNVRIQALQVAFGEVCAERGAPFVNVIDELLDDADWMRQIAAGDGAHPGAEGYDALARRVVDGGWLDWLRADPT